MTPPPRDGSRDRRIEDPSNLYLIHPASHALLPLALQHGVSANAVSLAGLACGTVAAFAYAQWHDPLMALVGIAFSVAWLDECSTSTRRSRASTSRRSAPS